MEYARVIITDIAYGGDGVGRLADGSVVFVPFTAVGDDVEIEITERKAAFCRGVARKFVAAGQGRATPCCRYYGRCGGCSYQHLTYETEVACKAKQFKTLMARVGKFESFPELESVNPSPQDYGYRNKLRLEPGERTLEATGYYVPYGYFERDNTTFMMVKSCPLAQDALNKMLPKAIRSDWGKQNAKRKEPYPLTLRITTDGDCCFYFGQDSQKLSWLKEKLLGVTYRVPVGGFWQVNPPVAERLLQTVKAWCEALPTKGHLLDIYGGAGTFTMQLGPMFDHRSLVESDVPAVNAADFALQEAGLVTELWKGPAEEFLSAADGPLANIDLDQTVAVIDPPRMGCLPKAISALRDRPPKYLIYVSCNPATLARDLKLLCADGLYKPEKCALFDMFPRTAHFESVVLLSKHF